MSYQEKRNKHGDSSDAIAIWWLLQLFPSDILLFLEKKIRRTRKKLFTPSISRRGSG
jgi:hypothetical protein